jgi:hypothetical protein
LTTNKKPVSEQVRDALDKMRLPGERLDQTILRLAGAKDPGSELDAAFDKALESVAKEDAQLLRRLAQ